MSHPIKHLVTIVKHTVSAGTKFYADHKTAIKVGKTIVKIGKKIIER
ncbi:MAG: hypothetical protein V4577_25915 [Bacteroidota bacterium]